MHKELDLHMLLGEPMGERLTEEERNTDLLGLLKIPKVGSRVQRTVEISRRHRDQHALSPGADHSNRGSAAGIANS